MAETHFLFSIRIGYAAGTWRLPYAEAAKNSSSLRKCHNCYRIIQRIDHLRHALRGWLCPTASELWSSSMNARYLFALVVLGLSSPAIANWEYTRWGMTQEEVIVASKGKAWREKTPGYGESVRVKYHLSGLDFTANFKFDRIIDLTRIRLSYAGGCTKVKDVFEQRFGEPESIEGSITKWRANGNEMSMSADGPTCKVIIRKG